MTLEETQRAVGSWACEYGICYFNELTNMAVLMGEVGELARIMTRKCGDQPFKEDEKNNISDEMADIP